MGDNRKTKYGVILARFQPVHNGHLKLIRKAAAENDEVIILVGSVDKMNERNPIPYTFRIQLLKDAIKEAFECSEVPERIKIVELPDLSDESHNDHEWGFYLYANIVEHCNNPHFTMYYSDGFEIITSWFPGWLLRRHISLSLMAREGEGEGISATKVRELILNDSTTALSSMVPNCIMTNLSLIKAYLSVKFNSWRT